MRWVVVTLVASSAIAEASQPIEPTSWVVEDPERWSETEIGVLSDLASSLPDSLARPGRTIVLRKGDLPDGDSPDGPHGVARARGRATIEVDTSELADEVARRIETTRTDPAVVAASREILRRQIVHALTHLADPEAGWSSSGTWKRLSDWQSLPTAWPRERDPEAYASPEGTRTPAEDLATTVERYFQAAPLPWDPPRYPGCGMRSKWTYVREHLGGRSPASDECAPLAGVNLDPERIEAIELLYVQASMRSPASLAGHLAVGLVYRPESGPRRIEAYQLAADTTGVERRGPLYLFRGLAGGFPSIVQMEPYGRLVLRYAKENRSVRRLRLRLDETEKRRLLERLDDARQNWGRRYLFMTRNCSYLPRTLIEWALQTKIHLPDLHGPDALLGALERMERLAPVPSDRLEAFNRFERAEVARLLREEDLRALRAAFPELADELGQQDAGALRAGEDARAQAIERLAAVAGSEDLADPAIARSFARYLAWSEELEGLRVQRSKGAIGAPVLDALWRAQGRLGALEPAGAPAGDGGVRVDLLEALNERAAEARTAGGAEAHTALRRVDLELGLREVGGASAGVLSIASSAYGYTLGEARRYTLARGLDLRLLESRLTLVLARERPEVESRLTLLHAKRLVGTSPVANPGVYLSVMAFDRVSGPVPQATLDFAEAGVLLELWQADDHRHHFGVSAGALGGLATERVFSPPADWTLEAGFPLRVFSRLGSKREPLSGVAVDAWWTLPPWWAGVRSRDAGARAIARARVGAIGGADVALTATWDARVAGDAALPTAHTFTQGVVVERF